MQIMHYGIPYNFQKLVHNTFKLRIAIALDYILLTKTLNAYSTYSKLWRDGFSEYTKKHLDIKTKNKKPELFCTQFISLYTFDCQ